MALVEFIKDAPQVAKMRHHPDAFPLTVQALQEEIETLEAFALRKVKFALQHFVEKQICPKRWRFLQQAHMGSKTPQSLKAQQALKDALNILSQYS